MKKLFFVFAALTFLLVQCSKKTDSHLQVKPGNQTQQLEQNIPAGPDNQCNIDGDSKAALRAISFGAVPSSVFYNFTLATASNVSVFLRDCCIRDDVVEVYVDGCLVATVDSRPGEFGTHAGETHVVTLPAGDHTIEYRNTVSLPGGSGWYVEETFSAASTLMIDGCDTGVPNLDVTCGNSFSDLINTCAVGAVNHGGFVSCVAHMTNMWKKAGLITGAQKDAIMECAAESNIPE
ncbi:MAG: hypothetical protein K2Q24_13215 [Chitinophagaceae bacterium]|jgi:hypothetical protein|nr:hypothetical protein [Chitinophagaceae bacterium]